MWIEGTVNSEAPAMPQTMDDTALLNYRNPKAGGVIPATLPTPEHIGRLAQRFASDVPQAVVNALYTIESNQGKNTSSYTSKAIEGNPNRTRIGVFQIQNHPGSHMAGDAVTSLAQGNFPSKELKIPYDDTNLVHSAIAGLTKIKNDWKKSGGDVDKFIGEYHGKGTRPQDIASRADYKAKFTQLVEGAAPGFNFFQGSKTNASVAAIANNPEKLKEDATTAATMRGLGEQQKSAMQANTDSTIAALLGLGKTGVDVLKAEYGDATDKAVAAKDFMKRALGFDVTSDNTNLTAAGKALDKNLGDILNLKEGLDKARSNPIYAILDGMSGGKTSKTFTDAIATRQAEATNISNAVNQIQQMATNASAIGLKTISSMSDAEFRAKVSDKEAKLAYDIAVTRGNADVKSVAVDMKIEKTITGIENATARLGLAQERSNLQQAGIELNNQIKAFKLATDQGNAEVNSEKKAEELESLRLNNEKKVIALAEKASLTKSFEVAGKALGLDAVVIAKQFAAKDPLTMEIVKGANEGTKTLGVLKLLDSKGRLEEADKIAVRRAVGNGGWADERSNVLVAGAAKLVDEKFSKLKAATNQSELDNRNLLIANAKAFEISKMQDSIVNVSGLRENEKNPYAANHALMLSGNQTLLAPVVSKPAVAQLYKAVASSQLYKSLQTEVQAGRKVDSDLTVLNAAVKLLQSKSGSEYSTQQAGEDISNYFRFAMLSNNSQKNYSAAGFSNQDTYGVNLTGLKAQQTSLADNLGLMASILPQGKLIQSALSGIGGDTIGVARNPKQAERAQLTDLANPQAATRAILTLAIQQRN